MKIRILTLLLMLGFFFTSCDNKNCSSVVCAPNSAFRFELVDTNEENLLSNGVLQISDIRIINLDSQRTIEFALINENNNDIIEINSIVIPTGAVNYVIQASEKDVFELLITTERTDGECCDVIKFSELKILNSEYLFDENRGIYTFLVE